MLRIHFSNSTEHLADQLLERLAEVPASPFDAEHLIVPHAGMRRYLELRHADRFGVAANLRCAYPAQWLWQQITRILPDASEDSPYSADVLTWRVLQWLETPPTGGRLAAYLAHSDALMRYELAERIARLIDQFVTYRPDWLDAWAAGKRAPLSNATPAQRDDEAWLAALWRHVLAAGQTGGGPAEHPALRVLQQLEARAAQLGDPAAAAAALGLPARVALFGLAELPPFYLTVLARLARAIDVDCYVFNPCREYWFDIVSEQRRARLAAEGRMLHHETGNALLAHWGGQTRAFIEAVLEFDEGQSDDAWVETGHDAAPATLHQLQRAVLDLAEPEPGSLQPDDSVVIFSCHTITRQFEVLQDQLLAAFDADPSLRPHDVLVVMPDLERAAAAIESSFGTVPPGHARHIPWRITGRPAHAGAPLAQALFALLDLAASRFEASALFDVLQQPAVARRFGLDELALDAVHGWLRETGIHWGRDAAHRASLDLPASERHTLEHGLAQLFLGYALPLPTGETFADTLPYGDLEGQQAEWLGALWSFVARLDPLREQLRSPRSMTEWSVLLQRCLDDFLAPAPADVAEALALGAALGEAARLAASGGAEALAVPIEVARRALEARLAAKAPGGTPGGAVTFTGMTPLRQIPYRVVCVLGLDHGVFPADAPPDEFDLMAAFPRPGDRQRRRDDRNVFLDLVLAARDRLFLGYNGRHSRDNSVLPPSVVVDELIDWLVRAAVPAEAGEDQRVRMRAQLVTVHPLQAHAPRYFDGSAPRLFSYRTELSAALAAQAAGRAPAPRPFFAAPLPPPDEAWQSLSIDDLVRFLRNPAAVLIGERLAIDLGRHDRQLSDDEPFALATEDSWGLKDRVLALFEAGLRADRVRAVAALHNAVPDGIAGALALEPLLGAAQVFTARLAGLRAADPLPPLPVQLDFGTATLGGELTGLYPHGQVLWRFGKEGAWPLLEAWVRHLVLCCVRPPGVAPVTWWLGEDGNCHFTAPENPQALLADLIALRTLGLTRPVHFFPRTAWEFMREPDAPKYRETWHRSGGKFAGESDHPAWRLALDLGSDPDEDAAGAEQDGGTHAGDAGNASAGGDAPAEPGSGGADAASPYAVLDDEFFQMAQRVYGPLLAARVEGLDAAH